MSDVGVKAMEGVLEACVVRFETKVTGNRRFIGRIIRSIIEWKEDILERKYS